MAHTRALVMCMVFLPLGLLIWAGANVEAQSGGVCWGMMGNNLPQPNEVVSLLQSKNIKRVRLYDPHPGALNALRNTGIEVMIGITNTVLQDIANDQSKANGWVFGNISPYGNVNFKYINVGNEAIPGSNAQYILPAMKNIANAVQTAGLQDKIKVSTSVATSTISNGFPPSQGVFSAEAAGTMGPIVQYLASTGAPLLVNVYPYFSYKFNRAIDIRYALFTANWDVVTDQFTQLRYRSLFDAIVDGVYSAMDKTGGGNVPIVISESGWPSAGNGDITSVANAQTYNQNLMSRAGKGTPKRPGAGLEIYIFALFNENQKPAGEEQNFGLFFPNKQPVYNVNF